jgi:tRNA threonylcarbamoyladenosine biosynthesis protein TsaB
MLLVYTSGNRADIQFTMRVLALDTTTPGGSVALVEDDRIIAERLGDPVRTYAERLPTEILSLLEEQRLGSADVDVFAVAPGPGSFTGLRIGIATIQGLALVHGRRVAAVSALAALAHVAGQELNGSVMVAAWMDARRAEVFSALYRLSSRPPFDPQRLVEVEGPAVASPAATLARWEPVIADETVIFAGDGAEHYREVIQGRQPSVRIIDAGALAGAIGLVAVAQATSGATVEPAAVRPLYVRRPDAELDREKRARHQEH